MVNTSGAVVFAERASAGFGQTWVSGSWSRRVSRHEPVDSSYWWQTVGADRAAVAVVAAAKRLILRMLAIVVNLAGIRGACVMITGSPGAALSTGRGSDPLDLY